MRRDRSEEMVLAIPLGSLLKGERLLIRELEFWRSDLSSRPGQRYDVLRQWVVETNRPLDVLFAGLVGAPQIRARQLGRLSKWFDYQMWEAGSARSVVNLDSFRRNVQEAYEWHLVHYGLVCSQAIDLQTAPLDLGIRNALAAFRKIAGSRGHFDEPTSETRVETFRILRELIESVLKD